MPQILVLYHQPANPADFDKYYFETHVPIAKKIKGLKGYSARTAPPRVLGGKPARVVATLTFDSMADLDEALASPEGQATAADLANFADGGATILIFETKGA